jgi:WD40 repeat protein/tRNA A-37 threonylcarbamoyl transferase component Bud32
MADISLPALVEALRHGRLLTPAQLDEVDRDLQRRFPEPLALARELLRRGWLTAFQVNQLMQGRGQELVLGQYVLLERLGGGGMGRVFKALHRRLERVVAIKVIRKDLLEEGDVVQRFQREAKAGARLANPHIVTIHDADEVDGRHFLVMEYLEGADLERVVREHGPLPVAQACAYARQAALALQHLHEHDLVHRDVKPANLLRTASGDRIKLLDLGLARLHAERDLRSANRLTQEGAVLGTLDFLAPEQATDARAVDIRADLYSLGCTLFFLLTGRVPFPGTAMEMLFKHRWEELPPVEQGRPEVSPALAAVVRKLMAKRPEDRYQTPAEAAAALAAVSDGEAAALTGSAAGVWAGVPRLPLVGGGDIPLFSERGKATALGKTPGPSPRWWRGWADPRSRWWPYGLGVLLLAVISLGAFLALGPAVGPPEPPSKKDQSAAPLDQLSWEKIPAAERVNQRLKGLLVAVLGEHRRRLWGQVLGVALHPNGKVVAACGNDRAIRLWDLATDREGPTLRHGRDGVYRIAFSPNGKLLAALAGTNVELWNTVTGRKEMTLLGKTNGLDDLAFAPNGRLLAAGGISLLPNAGAVQVWNLPSGQTRVVWAGHKSKVWAVAFAPDSRTLASGSRDHNIILWDVANKKKWKTLRGHTTEVTGLAFAPAGRVLASADQDGKVKLWDVDTGQAKSWPAGERPQTGWRLAYTRRGDRLATVWADGRIRLWNTATLKLLADLAKPQERCYDLAISGNGQVVATGHGNGAVRLWQGDGLGPWHPLKGHQLPPGSVAVARDGRTVVTGGWDSTAKLWDVASGKERATLRGHLLPIRAVAFAPRGQTVATVSNDGQIKLWDSRTGHPQASWKGHTDGVLCVTFASDGKTLATGGKDGTVRLWDVVSHKERAKLQGHSGPVLDLALAPLGGKLVAAGEGGTVTIWTLTPGQPKAGWKVHLAGVNRVAFAPDSRTVALGDRAGGVFLWDFTRRKKPRPLPLFHKQSICHLAFAPDSATLVSVSVDGHVVRWERAPARKLLDRKLPGGVYDAALAADGRHLATANANGTVYILRLAPPPSAAP